MKVILPDGNQLELPDGATGADAAAAIGPGLAKAALAIKQEGEVRDLSRPLVDDEPIEIITERSGHDALELVRHDAAHVLAAAVIELYPGVKISIGPAIENGFYYDFEFPEGVTVSDADFPAIEAKMAEHIKADEPFAREEISAADALERFRADGQDYKVELIEDLVATDADVALTLYTNGPFTDLCRGPHAPSTARIGAFKLQSVAGAYWRGDAANTMLTRIYGTAFFKQKELDAHLQLLEEARARDHRKLGEELDLFKIDPISPGSTFWLPKGTALFNQLVALNREMQAERGYVEVKTPQLYESQLWETSGHWGKYKENIFVAEYEGREFGLKPMNCPGHAHLYSLQRWSYRDLPYRCAEPGLLHRREPSGTLHGLMRVRNFVQDDAHIFCTEEQVGEEIGKALDFAFDLYRLFDLPLELELSTRPENRIGSDEFWDQAEGLLSDVITERGLEFTVNAGDGAFYAPKIDLQMTDSLGRSWQMGTIQLDYNLPERFDLKYTGADNAEHRPVMIHRAMFGSFERFIGVLIEHYAGNLPLWLAPVQAAVLPIADRHNDAAEDAVARLRAAGMRAQADLRGESVGRKIRDAETQKVPYMLIVGDKEAETETVSVRRHGEGDEGSIALDDFVARLHDEVAARTP
ncbi:MAG TPA: threonine--tRNA ligase [Baekduia sp.]|nr:threonine--tRNA ligase [Baekduia sp.]